MTRRRGRCECREQGKRCPHRHRLLTVDYSRGRSGGFDVEPDTAWRRTYRDDRFSERSAPTMPRRQGRKEAK